MVVQIWLQGGDDREALKDGRIASIETYDCYEPCA